MSFMVHLLEFYSKNNFLPPGHNNVLLCYLLKIYGSYVYVYDPIRVMIYSLGTLLAFLCIYSIALVPFFWKDYTSIELPNISCQNSIKHICGSISKIHSGTLTFIHIYLLNQYDTALVPIALQ